MKKVFSIILAVGVLAAVPAIASAHLAAAAYVHDCHSATGFARGPHNDVGAPNQVTSVRNLTCSTAGHAVANGYLTGGGSLRTRGFHCYVTRLYRSFGTNLGADVRCVSGPRAFRWIWGT